MKKKRNEMKRIFLSVTLCILFGLLAVDAAAITTPWIDIPNDTETAGSEEVSTQPPDQPGETTATDQPESERPPDRETNPGEDIAFDFDETAGTTARNETKAESKRSAETPKKKGCGSIIPQNGVWIIFVIGIAEMIFLMRKEKYHGTKE